MDYDDRKKFYLFIERIVQLPLIAMEYNERIILSTWNTFLSFHKIVYIISRQMVCKVFDFFMIICARLWAFALSMVIYDIAECAKVVILNTL